MPILDKNDPKFERKAHKIAAVVDNGDIAIVEHLFELEQKVEDALEQMQKHSPALAKVLKDIKGDKGDPAPAPVAGVDYPIPENGKDGKDYTPTESDLKKIAKLVKVPVIEKIIEIQKVEVQKIIEQPIEKVTVQKIENPVTPEEIRDDLESLVGEMRLDVSAIKGLQEFIQALHSTKEGMRILGNFPSLYQLRDVNVIGLQVGQSIKWDGIQWIPYTPGSGGGGDTFYNDTVSGTINGINRIFTVPNTIGSAINLVLANSSYQAGIDYTFSGNTITFTNAPDMSLSGQSFWMAYSNSTSILTETVSGTINGSNRTFTVPTAIITPIQLVLANSIYQNGVDYTTSGTTITFTTAPDFSLVGQPFWMVHT